ncbi:MAG: hypothetical protein LLG20_18575 [Acidobacteriales bacterium]|nr:hypothetical protein [Terriglobales bacterium]
MREILNRVLIVAGILCLATITAATIPLAITAWQSRDDLRGAVSGFRLLADRSAALVGETEPDEQGEPFTVARLVATSGGTVLLVRPVLKESAATVKAARKPLNEAAETIKAARPVLSAAKGALDAIPPAVAVAEGAVVELRGKLAPALENAAGVARQINETLPAFTDCEQNPACLENRWKGLSWDAEKSAREVARVAPVVADNAAAITTDVRTVARRAASPWSVVVTVAKKIKDWIF